MKEKEPINEDALSKRLDALIRLIIETSKSDKKDLNDATTVPILKSVGLTPTEIAKILGKKSRTHIAKYLYKK